MTWIWCPISTCRKDEWQSVVDLDGRQRRKPGRQRHAGSRGISGEDVPAEEVIVSEVSDLQNCSVGRIGLHFRRTSRISNLQICTSSLFSLWLPLCCSRCAGPRHHHNPRHLGSRDLPHLLFALRLPAIAKAERHSRWCEYKRHFPWRTAIKEEVLERRMPPWGAVKGFGDFRNDQALTPEQLELITSWSQGGSPEGDAKDLPAKDKARRDDEGERVVSTRKPQASHRKGEIVVNGDFKLIKPFTLDGMFPKAVPADGSFQIIAELPDGRVEPLLWLEGYKSQFEHAVSVPRPRLSLPSVP